MLEQAQQTQEAVRNLFALAAVLGIALTLTLHFAWLKNKWLSATLSSVIGIVLVLVFFNSPATASNLGGVFNNLTLLIHKAIWLAGWIAPSFAVAYFLV